MGTGTGRRFLCSGIKNEVGGINCYDGKVWARKSVIVEASRTRPNLLYVV